MSNKMFHRHCYSHTGWLPMAPLTRALRVGDVAQIRRGTFQTLLNIDTPHLVAPALSPALVLDGVAWHLAHAAQQTFCETRAFADDLGEQSLRTRQVIEFGQAGGFMFHAGAVSATLLMNWHQIRDEVTLKLTQLHYSFREAYVVTAVARATEWALVVAGQGEARLEMAAATGHTDRFSLLSHASASTEKCHGIAEYEKGEGRAAYFFKAKKLVISDAMHDRYLAQVVHNPAQLAAHEVAAWLEGPLLDLVKTNELNLNSSIDFFTWVDVTLDDVERLSGSAEEQHGRSLS